MFETQCMKNARGKTPERHFKKTACRLDTHNPLTCSLGHVSCKYLLKHASGHSPCTESKFVSAAVQL
jgi:hypothetical protein